MKEYLSPKAEIVRLELDEEISDVTTGAGGMSTPGDQEPAPGL